jgi:hypothetical protein
MLILSFAAPEITFIDAIMAEKEMYIFGIYRVGSVMDVHIL